MSNCGSLELEKQTHSAPCAVRLSGPSMPFTSCESCIKSLHNPGQEPRFATPCEIFSASFASLITNAYTLHHGKRVRASVGVLIIY